MVRNSSAPAFLLVREIILMLGTPWEDIILRGAFASRLLELLKRNSRFKTVLILILPLGPTFRESGVFLTDGGLS